MGIGHMHGTGTCRFIFILRHSRKLNSIQQDLEFFLQEYSLYRCIVVVSNLLFLEFRFVCRLPVLFECRVGADLLFSSVFEYTYLLFWNSFWTIAPVIGIGLFDRVVGMPSSLFGLYSHSDPPR